jgi:hypothetical protein
VSKAKTKGVVCSRCNLLFEDEYDIEDICADADDAASCTHMRPKPRLRSSLQLVGADTKRLEDDPEWLRGLQDLIDNGTVWHKHIDADGSFGRKANDLITRKLCRAPRGEGAKKLRHMFDVAQRFGIATGRDERNLIASSARFRQTGAG